MNREELLEHTHGETVNGRAVFALVDIHQTHLTEFGRDRYQ